MTDIATELRRLYAAVPQGRWTCEGPDFHGYRIFSADEKVLNHTLTEAVETADLIVAMHAALPALLDAIDTLRWYADERNYNDFCPGHSVDCGYDGWEFEEDNGARARFALAALKQDGAS